MPDFLQGTRPTLTFLSESDRDQIHSAVLQVLGEVGMQMDHDQARELLLAAGCTTDGSVQGPGRVRIPEALLDRCLESAPSSIQVFNRLGDPAMDLGGRRSYFGSGSDLLFAQEPGGRREKRTCASEPWSAWKGCWTSMSRLRCQRSSETGSRRGWRGSARRTRPEKGAAAGKLKAVRAPRVLREKRPGVSASVHRLWWLPNSSALRSQRNPISCPACLALR